MDDQEVLYYESVILHHDLPYLGPGWWLDMEKKVGVEWRPSDAYFRAFRLGKSPESVSGTYNDYKHFSLAEAFDFGLRLGIMAKRRGMPALTEYYGAWRAWARTRLHSRWKEVAEQTVVNCECVAKNALYIADTYLDAWVREVTESGRDLTYLTKRGGLWSLHHMEYNILLGLSRLLARLPVREYLRQRADQLERAFAEFRFYYRPAGTAPDVVRALRAEYCSQSRDAAVPDTPSPEPSPDWQWSECG